MNSERKKKPNLLIIGVHKAGTTSVFEYLSAHPDICGSRRKELHYYTPLRFGRQPGDFRDYLREFRNCGDQKYILEASPSYLYGREKIAARIKADLENVKLLLILRDPVDRFISYYRSLKTTLRLDIDIPFDSFLEECIRRSEGEESEDIYVRGFREGLYSDYIGDWLRMFDSVSLKVAFFSGLKKDPSAFMSDIARWLGIDESFYGKADLFNVSNRTRMPSNIRVHRLFVFLNRKLEFLFRSRRRIKHFLREIYYKMNREIETEAIPQHSVERLRRLYREECVRLRSILVRNDIVDLPDWLEGGH